MPICNIISIELKFLEFKLRQICPIVLSNF